MSDYTDHIPAEQIEQAEDHDRPLADFQVEFILQWNPRSLPYRLAREVQASRKLIADLRALHVAEVDDDDESPTQGETFCVNCEHEDPCPTIRMIDEAGL